MGNFFKVLQGHKKQGHDLAKEATDRSRKGEVRKGARRMPRCQEPKKDGANTEMPRGAVSER